jgi:hypothetical protein
MKAITIPQKLTGPAVAVGIAMFVAVLLGLRLGYAVAGPWVEQVLGR